MKFYLRNDLQFSVFLPNCMEKLKSKRLKKKKIFEHGLLMAFDYNFIS